MSETDQQIGCAFDMSEPLPTALDWKSALGAVLRKDFDGATVQHVFTHRRGVQVRVVFGSPKQRSDVSQVAEAMLAAATELARRMRRHEEETTLADFERMEKDYRDGVTMLQRGNTLMAAAKSAAEFTTATTTLAAALKLIAKVVLPPHLSGMLP